MEPCIIFPVSTPVIFSYTPHAATMPSFQSVINSHPPPLPLKLPLSETFTSSITWMTPVILDVLVGILQRNRTDKIFIYMFWRLPHMILVVEILQAGEIGKLVEQFSLSP